MYTRQISVYIKAVGFLVTMKMNTLVHFHERVLNLG